jgi:hypothetical protein
MPVRETMKRGTGTTLSEKLFQKIDDRNNSHRAIVDGHPRRFKSQLAIGTSTGCGMTRMTIANAR